MHRLQLPNKLTMFACLFCQPLRTLDRRLGWSVSLLPAPPPPHIYTPSSKDFNSSIDALAEAGDGTAKGRNGTRLREMVSRSLTQPTENVWQLKRFEPLQSKSHSTDDISVSNTIKILGIAALSIGRIWMLPVKENDCLDADIRNETSVDEILWRHNVWTA